MANRIGTEDIFAKAARELCRRLNKDPDNQHPFGNGWETNEGIYRDELILLAEKINSLKSIGAI